MWLQSDDADNPLAINNGVRGEVLGGPGILGFQIGIAGRRVLDAILPCIGSKDFLAPVTGADPNNDQSLLPVLFEEFVVVRNGFHAWAAPGGVQIDNDYF